jgi:hypothetical protein
MTKYIDPSMTISAKDLLRKSGRQVTRSFLANYHRELRRVFPSSEIETAHTYLNYLGLEPETMDWDLLALRDSDGTLMGGIQFQTRKVPGVWLKKVIWAEHIWLVKSDEVRNFPNLMTLLRIASEAFKATGAQLAFFEFNDRAKMSSEEIAFDLKSGVAPEVRETMWKRLGAYVLVDHNGFLTPYDQPGMGGEEAVRCLSLGFFPLNCRPLDGNKLLVADYKAMLRATHSTIKDIAQDDPTMAENDALLDAYIAQGEQSFKFRRLADTQVRRMAIVQAHRRAPKQRYTKAA